MSEPDSNGSSGVLLGRPFLCTARTIIDVFDGTICLDFHGEKFTFNNDEAMRKPIDTENLLTVDVIAPLVQEFLEEELIGEKLAQSEFEKDVEKEIVSWCEEVRTGEMTDAEISEATMDFCSKQNFSGQSDKKIDGAKQVTQVAKPGTGDLMKEQNEKNQFPAEVTTAKKELNTLPPGLKYAYIENDEAYPVIINSKLTSIQEE